MDRSFSVAVDLSCLKFSVDVIVRARAAPYLCRDAGASATPGLSGLVVAGAPGMAVLAGGRAECDVGGARWPRLECSAVLVCARAPSLISVRGPGWLRVGNMMGDGVIPQ
jgi:hypothetical protein